MDMKHILCLLFAILVTNAFAVDHFWDMRYNFGPESRPSPKIGGGIGIRSPFNSNVLFPINFTTRLNKEFDVGAKLDINTYNKLDEIHTALDLGVRYRYRPSSFIAFDGYLNLSETSQSALAFTIGTQQFIAKCFANYYELRAGFLEGGQGILIPGLGVIQGGSFNSIIFEDIGDRFILGWNDRSDNIAFAADE